MQPHPPATARYQTERRSWEGRTGSCEGCPHRRAAALAPLRPWIAPPRLPELLTQPRPEAPA